MNCYLCEDKQSSFRNMKHNSITSLFLLIAVLCTLSVTAHDFEVDGIYYFYHGNEATVVYKGYSYNDYSNEYSGDVIIPSSVTFNDKTYNVTAIGEWAFSYCTSVTSVSIPNSVTSIGNNAFRECSGMININIPNSITDIDYWVFAGCSSLKNITIPNSVTHIGHSAFSGSGLTSVTIPQSVLRIEGCAFSDCSFLSTLNFNAISCEDFFWNGAYSMPFYNSNISVINIGSCVQRIPAYLAFNQKNLTNINIPNSVNHIGREAFYGCSGLTSITMPDSLTTINFGVFYKCTSLTDITIPKSITGIGDEAFYGCKSLINISIPSSVKSIGDEAFSGCSSLISISIPNSVTSIGDEAFSFCKGLKTIVCYAKTPPSAGSSCFWSNPSIYDSTIVIVPRDSVQAYQTASEWENFSIIVGVDGDNHVRGDVNEDGNVNISDVTGLIDYLLRGSW